MPTFLVKEWLQSVLPQRSNNGSRHRHRNRSSFHYWRVCCILSFELWPAATKILFLQEWHVPEPLMPSSFQTCLERGKFRTTSLFLSLKRFISLQGSCWGNSSIKVSRAWLLKRKLLSHCGIVPLSVSPWHPFLPLLFMFARLAKCFAGPQSSQIRAWKSDNAGSELALPVSWFQLSYKR